MQTEAYKLWERHWIALNEAMEKAHREVRNREDDIATRLRKIDTLENEIGTLRREAQEFREQVIMIRKQMADLPDRPKA